MANVATQSPKPVVLNDSKTFIPIFLVSFAVLLVIALVAQLLAMQWRPWLPGAEGEKTLIGGVKSAVYTFMSHLS